MTEGRGGVPGGVGGAGAARGGAVRAGGGGAVTEGRGGRGSRLGGARARSGRSGRVPPAPSTTARCPRATRPRADRRASQVRPGRTSTTTHPPGAAPTGSRWRPRCATPRSADVSGASRARTRWIVPANRSGPNSTRSSVPPRPAARSRWIRPPMGAARCGKARSARLGTASGSPAAWAGSRSASSRQHRRRAARSAGRSGRPSGGQGHVGRGADVCPSDARGRASASGHRGLPGSAPSGPRRIHPRSSASWTSSLQERTRSGSSPRHTACAIGATRGPFRRSARRSRWVVRARICGSRATSPSARTSDRDRSAARGQAPVGEGVPAVPLAVDDAGERRDGVGRGGRTGLGRGLRQQITDLQRGEGAQGDGRGLDGERRARVPIRRMGAGSRPNAWSLNRARGSPSRGR